MYAIKVENVFMMNLINFSWNSVSMSHYNPRDGITSE